MKIYSNENIEKRKKRIYILTTILKIVITILIIPILLVNCILLLKSLIYPNETPDILGYKIFVVVSESMEPEINTGDLILVNKNKKPNIGDIITYKDSETITHRIVNIIEENNTTKYITKGDKNATLDKDLVDTSKIEGTYICKISGIGKLIIYLQNPFVLVATIMLIIALYLNSRTIEKRKIMRKQKRIRYENKPS